MIDITKYLARGTKRVMTDEQKHLAVLAEERAIKNGLRVATGRNTITGATIFWVSSNRDPNHWHHLQENWHGELECDCEEYRFKKNYAGFCAHRGAVRNYLRALQRKLCGKAVA